MVKYWLLILLVSLGAINVKATEFLESRPTMHLRHWATHTPLKQTVEEVPIKSDRALEFQRRLRGVHAAVQVATYWADDNGAVTNKALCYGTTPMSGTSACSLAAMNTSLVAGETVNLREGVYTTAIDPTAPGGTWSGSACTNITYQGYASETVTITNATTNFSGITLDGVNCIKITRVNVVASFYLVNIGGGSNYNEISYGTFSDPVGTTNAGINILTTGMVEEATANRHNWIHHSTIARSGYVEPGCNDQSSTVSIGADSNGDWDPTYVAPTQGDWLSTHNTFSDNHIFHGGHHVLKFNTKYNVSRNNRMYNTGFLAASDYCKNYVDVDSDGVEETDGDGTAGEYLQDDRLQPTCAPSGYYGNRVHNVLFSHPSFEKTNINTYNLIEANRIGPAGPPSDGNGADGLTLGGERDIARYNEIYGSNDLGIYFRDASNIADYNSVYNNTIAYNGFGLECRGDNIPSGPDAGNPIFPGWWNGGVRFIGGTAPFGSNYNYFINNILYGNYNGSNRELVVPATADGNCTVDDGANGDCPNWVTATGPPGFTNIADLPDVVDPSSTTVPDLTLTALSNAVNTASPLTLTNGSAAGGASTTLVVDRALFFQYGERGSILAGHQADWIAIGTVSNTVQICSIDYATNTITLCSAKNWSDNASVWLSKDSAGTIRLVGSAPDYGANERP
jgi:hypothetical protein